jgi:signal transduction histidine kinase
MMVERTGAQASDADDAMLQLAYFRALEMANFKGGFLARTAHELRSPLNQVISLHQMILEGLCENVEEEREFITEAHAAAMKLLEYLDFLMHVSKIEMGRLQPKCQSVPIADLLTGVQERNQLPVADRNLRLTVALPDPSLQVWTDPDWVQTILTTLIHIALDNHDRGTLHLSIASEAPAQKVYLWIEDDRPSSSWQESITLPTVDAFDLDDSLSASLRMAMVEAMLQALDGRLSLLAIASNETPTRLQLELPLSDR